MMNSNLTNRLDKVMTTEQFTQVVEAILEGKYSWACVLILRFAGYNPLHYIPYRTYNRLMKDHCQNSRRKRAGDEALDSTVVDINYRQYAPQVRDLNYLENLNESPQLQEHKVHGGLAGEQSCSHIHSISQSLTHVSFRFLSR